MRNYAKQVFPLVIEKLRYTSFNAIAPTQANPRKFDCLLEENFPGHIRYKLGLFRKCE